MRAIVFLVAEYSDGLIDPDKFLTILSKSAGVAIASILRQAST